MSKIDVYVFDGNPCIHICPKCERSIAYSSLNGFPERCSKCKTQIVEFICCPQDYYDAVEEVPEYLKD